MHSSWRWIGHFNLSSTEHLCICMDITLPFGPFLLRVHPYSMQTLTRVPRQIGNWEACIPPSLPIRTRIHTVECDPGAAVYLDFESLME